MTNTLNVTMNQFLYSEKDIISATESDLHYYFFCGDLGINIDGCDFSTKWGWVPLLDFIVVFSDMVMNLKQNDKSCFFFTESDENLCLLLDGKMVLVTASYIKCSALINFNELRNLTKDVSDRFFQNILSQYPNILENSNFIDCLNKINQLWE